VAVDGRGDRHRRAREAFGHAEEIAPETAHRRPVQAQQCRHVEPGAEDLRSTRQHDRADAFVKRGAKRLVQRGNQRGIEGVDRWALQADDADAAVVVGDAESH
jgi:hypothetical protein